MCRMLNPLTSWIFFVSSVTSAYAQSATQLEAFSNTVWGKIALATISAVLSLLVGYILLYAKERREPTKRLSYGIEIRRGMLGIEQRLVQDLSVTYRGRPASSISYVRCDLLNSGSSNVRHQRIRFEFTDGTEILDFTTDPKPPKEVGLAEFSEADDSTHEKTITFQQLEPQQRLIFHFVVEGESSGGVKLFGFNEEEDVQVVSGEISVAADDLKIAERVLFIYFLTLFVPHILFAIPIFGTFAAGLFYLVATIAVLPNLPTVARLLGGLIVSFQAKRPPSVSIRNMHAGGNVIVGTGDIGEAVQHMLPPDRTKLEDSNE